MLDPNAIRTCAWCDEPILCGDDSHETAGLDEDGAPVGHHWHADCFMRTFLGSVAHLQKRCSCYVEGSQEDDPAELTSREAATAAVNLWARQRREGLS